MKKIKIKASWTDDPSILKRLLLQFKTCDNDVKNMEFVFNDDYDLIFFFGYINEKIKYDSNAFVFPQEPTWTGTHQKYFDDNKCLKIYGFDKNIYSTPHLVEEHVSLMFYGGAGPLSEGWKDWSYENIINKNFNKTKKISSIVSNRGDDNNDIPYGCLYKKRVNLIKHLIKTTDYIDIFSWVNEKNNVKGRLFKKIDGLSEYKFSLCIENSHEKNYISEKFFDPVLTNTIPIYYGCTNIKDLIPENGYILLNNIDDIEEINKQLNYINDNCDKLYDEMLPNLLKIKLKYFNDFNPLKKIKEIVNK